MSGKQGDIEGFDLNSYIVGERRGRAAHAIERRAMEDSLLGEAIDGFDAVPGDHPAAMARLRARVTAAGMSRPKPADSRLAAGVPYSDSRAAGAVSPRPPRRSPAGVYSMPRVRAVAASLLLCLTLGGYMAYRLGQPRPTYGTMPAYPELNPWEGSRELIECNRALRASLDAPLGIKVGNRTADAE